METPRLPDQKPPAECTRAALEAFAPELTGLPPQWRTLDKDGRAQAVLDNKAVDAQLYIDLRKQAIRCAR